MKTTDRAKFAYAIFCCAFIGQPLIEADEYGVDWDLPYKFRVSENGTTYDGAFTFQECFYYYTEECSESHRDPDNNYYDHGHSWDPFDFQDKETEFWVGQQEVDWAYNANFGKDHDEGLGATFLGNCYSYVTDAPTPITVTAWQQNWTVPCSLCEITEKKKSFYVAGGHAILIYGTTDIYLDEPTCIITMTKEKEAASGVYTRSWFPLGYQPTPQWPHKRK